MFGIVDTKHLVRTSLLERLSEHFSKRVSVLLGPPGSGKTVIVKQWLESGTVDDALVVWFRVPDDILSNMVLMEYFLSAWPSFVPVDYFRKLLKNSTRTVLKSLGSYLSSNLSIPIVLVVDDVHRLSDYLRDWFFQDLITEFPPTTRFIFLSRELPPLDHIRLSSGDDLSIVRQDLNFAETEVYELGRRIRGSDVSLTFLKELWEQFRGWPIATVTALESTLDDFSHLREGLYQELFLDVLADMIPDERSLLLDMSVLDKLSLPLLREVLDLDVSENVFLRVVSRGYFFQDDQEYYQMHDVFRGFCLQELKLLGAKREAQLRARMARYYVKKAEFDSAFEQFLRADLLDELAKVLEFNPWMLSVSANSVLLLGFTKKLSEQRDFLEDMLVNRVSLASGVFSILNQTRMFDEVISLAKICLSLDIPSLSFYVLAWIKNNLMWAYLSTGQVELAQGIAQELLDSDLPNRMEAHFLAEADKVFGVDKSARFVLSYIREDFATMMGLYREALDPLNGDFSSISTNNITTVVTNSLAVSLLLKEIVNLDDPRVVYLLEVADRYSRSVVGYLAIDNLVPYFVQIGDFDRAGTLLEPYLEWDLTKGVRALIFSHYAAVLLNRAYFKDAYDYAKRCYDLIGSDSSGMAAVRNYVADLAELSYYQGLKADCRHWVEVMGQNALRLKSETEVYSVRLLKLYYELEDWNWSDVQADYLRLKGELAGKKLGEGRLNFQGIEFLLAYYRRDMKHATSMLQEIERHMEYENLRWFARQIVVRGLREAFDFDLFPRTQSLVFSFDANYRAGQSLKFAQPFRRLEISLLGTEVLRLDGVYLDMGIWLSSQSRYVFYYLLFAGSADSLRLASVFWPDKSETMAMSSLRRAISWVRGILGKTAIVHEDGIYSIGLDLKVECDIFELRKFVKLPGLDVVGADGSSILGTGTIERYVSGTCFLQEDFEWLADLRYEVSNLQSELLRKFVLIMRRRGHLQNVFFILDRFRRQNIYVEECWRWSFECLAQMGEMGKLAFLYKEMVDIFKRDLGILPSKVTRDLYESLIEV